MRETILNKATELFLDLGFKSVTMDDIATEMGISKKTIYPKKLPLILNNSLLNFSFSLKGFLPWSQK